MTSILLSINWSNALIVTLVGFGLVVVLLIVLVWVLMAFGWMFTHLGSTSKAPSNIRPVAVSESESGSSPQFLTDEEMAAVAVAVDACLFEVHDIEDLTLTINHEGQTGDWTSKYTVLTQ